MANKRSKNIKEKVRGLVPSASYGVKDKPYNEYLAQLNPKGETEDSVALRHALASASDRRFRTFLEYLYNPEYAWMKRQSLATLAKTCGIELTEFADFWNKAQHARTIAIAQSGMPAVTQDMVKDARTKQRVCERCDGFGEVAYKDATRVCPACKGKGEIDAPGDVDSRRLLSEIVGLTGKRAPMVQVNNNFGGMTIESAVDRMAPVSFDVSDVIDVEAIDKDKEQSL